MDRTGRCTLRQSSQAVRSRCCSTSTALTYRKRPPVRHGCAFSWSSCSAAGGRTNTPSGSTCRHRGGSRWSKKNKKGVGRALAVAFWICGGLSERGKLINTKRKGGREVLNERLLETGEKKITEAKKRRDLIGRKGCRGRKIKKACGLQGEVGDSERSNKVR